MIYDIYIYDILTFSLLAIINISFIHQDSVKNSTSAPSIWNKWHQLLKGRWSKRLNDPGKRCEILEIPEKTAGKSQQEDWLVVSTPTHATHLKNMRSRQIGSFPQGSGWK